eukprot:403339104
MIFNSYCIRDEQAFLQLANDYGKVDGNKVAILNQKVIFQTLDGGMFGIDESASQFSVICQEPDPIQKQKEQQQQCLQLYEQPPIQQMAVFSYKQALADPLKNPLLEFDNDIYEDAGSDIEETLRKAKRVQNLELRRTFFSPSLMGLQNNQLQPQNPNQYEGPYALLGKEDTLGQRLGDSVAEDVVFLAQRSKKIRKEVLKMKELVDALFELQYCSKHPQEITQRVKEERTIRDQKMRRYLESKNRRQNKSQNHSVNNPETQKSKTIAQEIKDMSSQANDAAKNQTVSGHVVNKTEDFLSIRLMKSRNLRATQQLQNSQRILNK